LLDEIEKAHPEVFNILLQVFEDGRLTDGKGKTVDFRNTIIIATSNIGSAVILDSLKSAKTQNQISLPKSKGLIKMKEDTKVKSVESNWEEVKIKLFDLLKQSFRPEFLNRIDEIIVFKPLKEKELENIVKLLMEQTKRLLKAQGIELIISELVYFQLARLGYDPQFGARPLRRVIQREIENPLSTKILAGEFSTNDKVLLEYKDNIFMFSKIK